MSASEWMVKTYRRQSERFWRWEVLYGDRKVVYGTADSYRQAYQRAQDALKRESAKYDWVSVFNAVTALVSASAATVAYHRSSCPNAEKHVCPVLDGAGSCGDGKCDAMMRQIKSAHALVREVLE